MNKLKIFILTLTLLFVCAIPTFAASEVPHINDCGFDYDNYFCVDAADYTPSCFVWSGTGDLNIYINSNGRIVLSPVVDGDKHIVLNELMYAGGKWTSLSSAVYDKSNKQDFVLNSTVYASDIVYSSQDIYDHSGTLVFPEPPTLAEVVAEEMSNFQVTMAGVMKTLVLCGVGCLACLMGLKVFGKVFQIFQV